VAVGDVVEQGAEDSVGVVDVVVVVVVEEDVVVAVDVVVEVEVEVVVSLSHIETIMIKRRKWIYFIIRFIPYPFGERLTTNVSIGGGG
jgi:hypothetical protein